LGGHPVSGRCSVEWDKPVPSGEFSDLSPDSTVSPPYPEGTRQFSKPTALQVFKPLPDSNRDPPPNYGGSGTWLVRCLGCLGRQLSRCPEQSTGVPLMGSARRGATAHQGIGPKAGNVDPETRGDAAGFPLREQRDSNPRLRRDRPRRHPDGWLPTGTAGAVSVRIAGLLGKLGERTGIAGIGGPAGV
jgi:hypothetical protein